MLIGSDTNPSCFINVTQNAGWVSVSFLDKELREYLLYSFNILNDNDIFLSTLSDLHGGSAWTSLDKNRNMSRK